MKVLWFKSNRQLSTTQLLTHYLLYGMEETIRRVKVGKIHGLRKKTV